MSKEYTITIECKEFKRVINTSDNITLNKIIDLINNSSIIYNKKVSTVNKLTNE